MSLCGWFQIDCKMLCKNMQVITCIFHNYAYIVYFGVLLQTGRHTDRQTDRLICCGHTLAVPVKRLSPNGCRRRRSPRPQYTHTQGKCPSNNKIYLQEKYLVFIHRDSNSEPSLFHNLCLYSHFNS